MKKFARSNLLLASLSTCALITMACPTIVISEKNHHQVTDSSQNTVKTSNNGSHTYSFDTYGCVTASTFFTNATEGSSYKVCYRMDSVDRVVEIAEKDLDGNTTLISGTNLELLPCVNIGGTLYGVVSIGINAFQSHASNVSGTLDLSGAYNLENISSGAFKGDANFTSVAFPSSLTTIGKEAFFGCTGLIETTFADDSQLQSIGDKAFWHCGALESIVFPDSLTTIGDNVFNNCTSLASASFQEFPNLTTIGESAFYNCQLLPSIILPDTVTSIGQQAFAYCTALSAITLPKNDSFVAIKQETFKDCSVLTDISIPASVSHIAENVFQNCNLLSTINFLGSDGSWTSSGIDQSWLSGLETKAIDLYFNDYSAMVSYQENSALWTAGYSALTFKESNVANNVAQFFTCDDPIAGNEKGTVYYSILGTNITITGVSEDFVGKDLTMRNQVTIQGTSGYTITSIGNGAFRNANGLSGVITLSNSIISIGDNAFRDSSITDIVFAGNSKANATNITVGDNCFMDCPYLESIDMTNIGTWGNNVFEDCYSLKEVTISATMGQIPTGSFKDCTSLKSVTIPDGIVSIGDEAFSGCTSLNTISWPDDNQLQTLGNEVFEDCTGLQQVTLIDSIQTIGTRLFAGCTSLKGVNLPNNVNFTKIPDQTFCSTSINTITIPSSVNSIGDDAFLSCVDLFQIIFRNPDGNWITYNAGTQTGINDGWLGGDTSTARNIYVPAPGIKTYEYSASASWFSESSNIQFVPVTDTVSANYFFDGATKGTVTYNVLDATSETLSIISVSGVDSDKDLTLRSAITMGETTWQVAEISSGSFNQQTMASLTIPSSVEKIDETAFGGCTIGNLNFQGSLSISSQGFNGGTIQNLYFAQPVSMEEDSFFITKINESITFASPYSNWISNLPFWLNSPVANVIVYVPDAQYVAYKTALENASWWSSDWIVAPIGGSEESASTFFTTGSTNDVVSGNVFYKLGANNTVEIYGSDGIKCDSQLVLKSEINIGGTPYAVNKIHDNAFYGNENIVDIDLSNQPIESIGEDAFYGCTSLSIVKFPNELEDIGNSAFEGTNLYSVTLPSQVQKVGARSFANCKSLTSVTFENRDYHWLNYGYAINNTWIQDSPVSTIYVHKDCIDGYRQYLEKYCLWYSQNPSIKLAPIEGEGNNLGLILGLSLGLGIPALAGIIFGIVYSVKRHKRY